MRVASNYAGLKTYKMFDGVHVQEAFRNKLVNVNSFSELEKR